MTPYPSLLARIRLVRDHVLAHVLAARDAERARRRGRGRSKSAAQRRRVRDLVDTAFDLVRGLGDIHAIVTDDGLILIEDSRLAATRRQASPLAATRRQASPLDEAGAKP